MPEYHAAVYVQLLLCVHVIIHMHLLEQTDLDTTLGQEGFDLLSSLSGLC